MKRFVFLLVLLAVLLLSACGDSAGDGSVETEGRLLLSADGTALLVTENGSPMVLSVEAEGDAPFAGFSTGDRISVTHDSVQETKPARTRAYDWELLENGTPEDIPEETLTALEALGWDFGREDVHAPAAEPQTVPDPVEGYCGNTVTEVVLGDRETCSFWGSDSVALTSLLENADYADGICRCMPEFTVNTESGESYGVNLTGFYVRKGDRQAPLTEDQAAEIQGILDRNCSGE